MQQTDIHKHVHGNENLHTYMIECFEMKLKNIVSGLNEYLYFYCCNESVQALVLKSD